MPSTPAKKRNPSFDLLRGGGVLYVVGYYHIQDVWMIHLPGHLDGWLARVALALFCFISGYLLANANTVTDWSSAKKFYSRRFLRIYPLYFVALLGFLGAGFFPPILFLPSALLVNTIINWNLLTLWFVSMIFLFYLITPLYLYRPSLFKTCWLTVLTLLCLIFLKLQLHWIDPRLFANFSAFAFGILLAQTPAFRSLLVVPGKPAALVSVLATSLLSWGTIDILPDDQTILVQFLIAAWFFATLPILFVVARSIARILPDTLIQFFATASFTLYLFHRLVFHFGANFGPGTRSWPQTAYYVLVLLPIAIFVAYLTQIIYDRFISRMSLRRVTPVNH